MSVNSKLQVEVLSPKDHTNIQNSLKSYRSYKSQALSMDTIIDFGFEVGLEQLNEMLLTEKYQAALDIIEKQLQQALKESEQQIFQMYFNLIIKLLSEKFSYYLNVDDLKVAYIILKKCEKFLVQDEKIYGPFNQLKVLNFNNWACYYRKIKNIPEAISILDEALKISYEYNLKQYKGLTNLNMGVLMNQIKDHEAAYECLVYAVSELYNDYFNLNNRNKILKKKSLKKFMVSQTDNQLNQENQKELIQNKGLLSISLYNLGIEEEYFCNYEKALIYFQQAEKIASENQENQIFSQQIQLYLREYQQKIEGIQQQRQKKNIQVNPLSFSYRHKCLSCVFNKQGQDMENKIQNQFEEFQKEKEFINKKQLQRNQSQLKKDQSVNKQEIQENKSKVFKKQSEQFKDFEFGIDDSLVDFDQIDQIDTLEQSNQSLKQSDQLQENYISKEFNENQLKISTQKSAQLDIKKNISQTKQQQQKTQNLTVSLQQQELQPFNAQSIYLEKNSRLKKQQQQQFSIHSNLINSYIKSYTGQELKEKDIQKQNSQIQQSVKSEKMNLGLNLKESQSQNLNQGIKKLSFNLNNKEENSLQYSLNEQQNDSKIKNTVDNESINKFQNQNQFKSAENKELKNIHQQKNELQKNVSYNFKDTKNNNIKKWGCDQKPINKNKRQLSQQSFISTLKPYKQLPSQLQSTKNSLMLNNNNSYVQLQSSFFGTSTSTNNLFNSVKNNQNNGNLPKILKNEQKYKYDNFQNALPLLDNYQSLNANTDLQNNAKIVNPSFFLERRREKSLPNVNSVLRKNKNSNKIIRDKMFDKKLFKDKAVLDSNSCDCILCKRIFGLPKNYITVYPYRNAQLTEIQQEQNLKKSVLISNRSSFEDSEDLSDSEDSMSIEKEIELSPSPLRKKKPIIRRGKLCAGFEKEKNYLLLCFKDQEQEDQDEDTGKARDPEKGSNVHYIDFTEFFAEYDNQYNIYSEDFLSMLHYICQQLRQKMSVNYLQKTILLDNLNEGEIYVYKPKSTNEWPAYFVKIDDQHSKLKRFYSETDEQFLNKQRKEICSDKENKIFATDFEQVKLGNTKGYLYSYIDRPNCNLIICFLIFQRIKFEKISSTQYEHCVFLGKVYQTLGTFQESKDTKLVINETINHFKSNLQIDPVLNWLHVPNRRERKELYKIQIQDEYRFIFQSKMTYEAGSTDINVNKKNFGMRHEINIIKLQKWVRRRLTKLKFLSKLRDSIKKKYIVLYRGRQYDKYGVLQRLQILESVFYPKVYWVAMEQINCICLNEDGIKLNTTHELSKSLACEIAEDENPWKYFQVSYKNNTVELKQQQLFWKKLEFHGYPFIVIIYRHFEPERTQVQLRADKELLPDFEFKRGEYITPSIARAIIKSSTPEDHFLVRPLKQEFRLVDPAIKNRSAIKIQRFIRSIFGRLKARNERQRQIRHRIEAAKRIQIYYIYYKWRVHFWAERVVEYKFLKYSQSLVLKKQLGLLKQTFEKVKFRRKMAAKIWILYKYAKWRKAWKKKWMAKRNFAATRIQIYIRYYIWRKVWVKRYKEMKRQQAAKRLQIYARYKIWWKRWHVKYVYKRNRGASRIQLYWKYKKWQVQWKAQWRKRRFMAAALITSLVRLWFKRRKKASGKISRWGKNMLVKIKTKKEIGWDGLKKEYIKKQKAIKIQKQFRRYIQRKMINEFILKRIRVRMKVKQYYAACKIQRSYRKKFQKRKMARERLRKLIKMVIIKNRLNKQALKKIQKNIAARKIQKFMKKKIKDLKEKKRKNKAAIKIQKWVKKVINKIREKRYGEKKKQSIIKIQRYIKKRYIMKCGKANIIKKWIKRKQAIKVVRQKYQDKFNKLYYYIQTVLLPFIIENPEEEEKQDEEEQNEKSSQNNQDKQESDLKDKLQEKEKNEENKNLQGEIIMKEQMFHFIINRDPEIVDRYQGGVESLQQPYFNTTQQKLSRCITYFFAHKLQQVKIFPYKEKLSEPNRYFDIDVQNKTGGISRKLKIYVAVLTIQKIFRSTLQMLLRKGIMCYPQSDYQLIQEVSHPLFIFTKDFGFTVSFSFMAQKEQNQKHVIKLDQFFGNQLKFGMNYDEELTVVYKTKTQRQKMYSIRKIRYGLEYHCTLVYILQPGDIYDLRLYINGTMEGQTSMRKFDRMRLPSTFEFIGGTIYNEFVMTKAISAKEVFDLYIERLYVLEYQWFNYKKPNKRRRYLRGITKVKNQEGVNFNQNNQVKKYNQNRVKSGLKKKNLGFSINGIQNQSFLSQAQINTEQKEIIKQEKFQYQVKQNLTINKFIRSLAQEILRNKEKILILCQILSPCLNGSENLNFECLNTQLSSGNIKNNLEGEYVIEIERFLQILQNCEINTTVADLGELALLTKTLKTFKYTDEKNDKTYRYTGIFYYKIVQVLRDILQPHQGFLKQNQQSQQQLKQEIQEVQMPDIPDDWNTGAFQVGITHCTNCNYHQLTGWHQEIEFVEVFNDIGIFLKEVFPNIIVKGNQIKPSKMEHFDIYIRGVNSKNLLDIRPHYIYKKQSQMEDFLKNYTKKLVNVYDQLVFMIFKFMKFSEEMAQFQETMFENNQKVLPAEYKGVHNHPYELSEDQTKNIPVYKSKRCKYFKKENQNYKTK